MVQRILIILLSAATALSVPVEQIKCKNVEMAKQYMSICSAKSVAKVATRVFTKVETTTHLVVFAYMSQRPDIARAILEKKPKLKESHLGEPLMHLAARLGYESLLNYTIERMPHQIESRNTNQETPLMIAAASMNLPAVHSLIEAGADPNACSQVSGTMETALSNAIYYVNGLEDFDDESESTQIVKILLEEGALVSTQNLFNAFKPLKAYLIQAVGRKDEMAATCRNGYIVGM